MTTPIAVFTYNRPEHTLKMLTSLAACRRLNECSVTIYCDGARSPEKQAAVDASRAVVRAWAEKYPAQVVERKHNVGLATSIVTGVTELCQQYGRVIVLEDDLILAPGFLDYQLQALDFYEQDERVYTVAGHCFPFDILPQQAFLQPLQSSHGWGTWWRAWQHYQPDADTALAYLANPAHAHAFDLDGYFPYTRMLRHTAAGSVDSWAVWWWYVIFRQGGLGVFPTQSFIEHIGNDGSGSNFREIRQDIIAAFTAPIADPPVPTVFPTEVNSDLYHQYRAFLKDIFVAKPPTLPQRIIRRLKRGLKPLPLEPHKTTHGKAFLNIGCGDTFHPDWTNIDLVSHSPQVVAADIRAGLPYRDHTFNVVYHAHIIEHLKRADAYKLLQECRRVLKSKGVLRVVAPDLRYSATLYLQALDAVEIAPDSADLHEQYEWAVLNLIDQMVRVRSGGEMLAFVRQANNIERIITQGGGTDINELRTPRATPQSSIVQRANRWLRYQMTRGQSAAQREAGFRAKGEVHQWMYDAYSLSRLLTDAGFVSIQVQDADTSGIPDWATYQLDRDAAGVIRKPYSLFIEAIAP